MIALRRQIDALKAGGGAVDSLSLPAQLQAQKQILAQARQRYSEDHPDVKRIERQIKSLETRIASGETSAGNPVGSPAVVQLKTQINALDNQMARPRAAPRRAAHEARCHATARRGNAADRARIQDDDPGSGSRAHEVRRDQQEHDGFRAHQCRHRQRTQRRAEPGAGAFACPPNPPSRSASRSRP